MYKNLAYAGDSIDSKVNFSTLDYTRGYKPNSSGFYLQKEAGYSAPRRRIFGRRKDGFTVTRNGVSFARQRRVLFQAPEKKGRNNPKKDSYRIYKPRNAKDIYSRGLYEIMLKENMVGFVFGQKGDYKILLIPKYMITKPKKSASVSSSQKSGLEHAVSVD